MIDLSVQSSSALAQVQWTATDPLNCPDASRRYWALEQKPDRLGQWVSVNGCPGQDDLYVDVLDRPLVFIPNSFHPMATGSMISSRCIALVDDVRTKK